MTYIHWMKRNGTERNHAELHYDHHQDCITLGCKSSAFISSNIIWLSVYVCESTMYKLERKSMRTKKENLLVLLPYFSYFSLLFLAFVNDVRLSFNSFFAHCMWFVCVGRWIRLPVLSWDLFFYSIVDVVVPERKMMYKKHMHIYSLSIYDQWVYLCFDWIVRLLSWTLEMNEETAKAENVDRKICYWNCCGAETNE